MWLSQKGTWKRGKGYGLDRKGTSKGGKKKVYDFPCERIKFYW